MVHAVAVSQHVAIAVEERRANAIRRCESSVTRARITDKRYGACIQRNALHRHHCHGCVRHRCRAMKHRGVTDSTRRQSSTGMVYGGHVRRIHLPSRHRFIGSVGRVVERAGCEETKVDATADVHAWTQRTQHRGNTQQGVVDHGVAAVHRLHAHHTGTWLLTTRFEHIAALQRQRHHVGCVAGEREAVTRRRAERLSVHVAQHNAIQHGAAYRYFSLQIVVIVLLLLLLLLLLLKWWKVLRCARLVGGVVMLVIVIIIIIIIQT
mmetsp:Transcript_1209/g.2095  ORF Transcript_1209/g.2095 Transcript_1209/m.2095 type:complete len:265 (+) Transcript_1209:212-1006(+)